MVVSFKKKKKNAIIQQNKKNWIHFDLVHLIVLEYQVKLLPVYLIIGSNAFMKMNVRKCLRG